ncbi:hypothetical protein [Pseudomonas sp. UFMG81]|uniref:hypothetical protein n=1 Tax=Pseudomonas sp. UFMG81 TaxID=2745936 RepID=UPI00188F8CB9
MSTSTAVHSNAFNFMSFLQSGVDPRTGQYTVSLTLPEVEANALLGPALNLALFFNPLNTQDSGYGKGWNLQLSQFDPENQVVALHTGESFKATRTAGTELFMEEKKLDSFKLHQKAEPGTGLAYYEVRHRSGLIEKLQRFEASRPLYLPAEIRTAQTRPLKLAYTPFIETSGKRARFEKLFKGRFQYTLTKLFNRFAWFEKLFKRHCQYTLTELFNQTHYRLASIQGADADGNYRDLLTVERTTTALTITLNPAGAPQQQAVFVLQLDGEGKVTELQLPSVGGNQGKWRFRYESHHGHDCLTEVRTPTGAWELIEYDPEGHGFSNGISGRLPRVARHEIRPGDKDGPAAANKPCNQVFTYSYALTTGDADYQAGNNFLGANLALGDPDPTPGLDILYRHSGSYRYGSVEQLRAVDGSVARTLERQFNKFHLLAWEQERQGPADDQHLRTVETTYSYDPAKPFKDQRADCQLPQDTTTRWRKRSSGDERQEVIKRTYHDDGNLHTEEQPNGVIETSLWYPSTGEGSDCPADPDGFARHLKSKTTTPGPGAQAPTLRTRYRYRTLAALPGNTQDQSWHVVDEELLEQMTGEQASTLQSIQHTYYDDSNDAFIHGRLHSQALTMNAPPTRTASRATSRARPPRPGPVPKHLPCAPATATAPWPHCQAIPRTRAGTWSMRSCWSK